MRIAPFGDADCRASEGYFALELLFDVGSQHFDGDIESFFCSGAMHLCYRGGGGGFLREVAVEIFELFGEGLFYFSFDCFEGEGWHSVLQQGEGLCCFFADEVGTY